MNKKLLGTVALLTVPSAFSFAQEGAFTDLLQPMRSFVSFKNDFEVRKDIGCNIISNGELEVIDGNQVLSATDSQRGYFSITNFAIPREGIGDYIDVDFDVAAEAGISLQLGLDLTGGDSFAHGTMTNGGVKDIPTNALTKTVHMHFHRKLDGLTWNNLSTKGVITLVPFSNGVLGGGNLNGRAKIRFDNLRVTFPKRLIGISRITGTTDKNLGFITFSDSGTKLGIYKDWVQNLGNVNIIDVFGRTNFGYDVNAKSSSNLLLSRANGNSDELVVRRFFDFLDGTTRATSIGTAVANGGGNRYYGISADENRWGQQYLFRQNYSNGQYTHWVRCLSDGLSYGTEAAKETEVDLGGEPLVAVGDFNGDGRDDFITLTGNTFSIRLFTGNNGKNQTRSISVSDPITVANQDNYLKVLAVDDINGDGCDDLLLQDTANGQIFAGFCSAYGMKLDWLFALNLSTTVNENILALADADGDGLPDIYTTRINPNNHQPEIDVRKIDTMTDNAQISAYTKFAAYDQTFYSPCAVGDINGDGAADVVMVSDNGSQNQLATFLANPTTRTLAGEPHWITKARGSFLRPIFK